LNIFTSKNLQALPSRERATLINAISGIRSANLIATRGDAGTNLSVFNSVTHLGSSPALLGMVFRPLSVERHTYSNIKNYKDFTINAITTAMVPKAHQTSAKYPEGVSEFDAVGFQPLFREETHVPFVEGSPIQVLCTYSQEHVLENQCILLTASIKAIWIDERGLSKDHFVNHEQLQTVGIGGLDAYYTTRLEGRYAYAKPDQPTTKINQV
jgi:flavin reductase (DIM6/NTAB) family NADH-FMN oxidoreductase RutF